eukprot:gb/GEZN01016428.1/.p1 GENE.gb/GEZN01016428.1/~~gb/GEZN01016428.1/.p1  ORF type:complete len:256 (-),score=18.42 gb/GEZN01016428.1/:79-795(-)
MNGYWFRRARPFVLSQGFKPHPVFKCTFFRKCPKSNKTESIVIWVDNFNTSFSSKERMLEFRQAANKAFKKYTQESGVRFAGWDIKFYSEKGVRKVKLSHQSQIEKMAQVLGLEGHKPVNSPWLPTNYPARPSVLQKFSPHVVMGNLIAIHANRPDMTTVISILAKNQSKPDEFNYLAAEHAIRYVIGTKSKGIIFSSDKEPVLEQGYCDAGYKQTDPWFIQSKILKSAGSCAFVPNW